MEKKYAVLSSIEDISMLNGTAFEGYLAAVFRQLGYSVDLTPASGDYGADLILSCNNKRIVVQAKQHSKPAGFDSIKEIHFARTYYSASDAWVIATHGFTQQAADAASTSDIRLIDGEELLSMAAEARSIEHAQSKTSFFSNSNRIDHALLKAACLVMKTGNTNPGFLEERLIIGFEQASRLLNQMESFGIIYRRSDEGKVIISNENFVELIDTYYDAKTTKPRFKRYNGHPYEIFRGSKQGVVIVVENPLQYPSFYTFEFDPTATLWVNQWICVGTDLVVDTSNDADISKRKDRLSDLKLFDVLETTNSFTAIEWAYQQVRTGKAEVQEPNYVQYKLKSIKEAADAKELEQAELTKKLQEERRRRKRNAICLALLITFAILIAAVTVTTM